MVAVMLGGGWAMACPRVCSCRHQSNLLVANCTSLPYSIGKVDALTLLPPKDARLELRNGQFNHAKHLKYLTLKNCSIYYVHNKSFYGTKNITEIDLSFNFIEELDPIVFQHLNNLKSLSLRGNPIHLESEMPMLISDSITHLDIGHCKIENIPSGIFYQLKRLKYLYLDGNLLTTLEYNSLPKILKYLDISDNLIVNVPTEVISALSSLRRIDIAGNPVNCSCSLIRCQDWLSGRAVIFERDVLCSLPAMYDGVSWSKINEDELCLLEARIEELKEKKNPDSLGSSMMENQFDMESSQQNHFNWGNDIQSDTPGSSINSEAEVFMKNDDTIAMGEMMRDEGETTTEKRTDINIDYPISEVDTKKEADEKNSEKKTVEVPSKDAEGNLGVEASEDENSNVIIETEPDSTSIKSADFVHSENSRSNIRDFNKETKLSSKDADKENLVDEKEESPLEENLDDTSESTTSSANRTTPTEKSIIHIDIETLSKNQVESVQLNGSAPVVFTTEDNAEIDEFKKEGLVHVNEQFKEDDKVSILHEELATDIPRGEDVTEDEGSGNGPLIGGSRNETDTEDHQNSTYSPNNSIASTSSVEVSVTSEKQEEVLESTTIPVLVPDLHTTIEPEHPTTQESTDISEAEEDKIEAPIVPELTETEKTNTEENTSQTTVTTMKKEQLTTPTKHKPGTVKLPENEASERKHEGSERDNPSKEKEGKVKEMAGVEVVLFCVAVILICLFLYAVYKCKGSKDRENVRDIKDLESNRGTEMQDMASLLPKPQDEKEKKFNLKYEDKAPSSETVKLLTEQNENESNNFTPAADTKTETEGKHSLNNNTNGKAPQIKSEHPVTISPTTPIQRTKVKVGIIPDSIPRTPVFLQKTHNGTNNV